LAVSSGPGPRKNAEESITIGAQGSHRNMGDQGPQGPTGATGPQGPAGLQGPQGDQGDPGPAGADGADGMDGADGSNVNTNALLDPLAKMVFATSDNDRYNGTS